MHTRIHVLVVAALLAAGIAAIACGNPDHFRAASMDGTRTASPRAARTATPSGSPPASRTPTRVAVATSTPAPPTDTPTREPTVTESATPDASCPVDPISPPCYTPTPCPATPCPTATVPYLSPTPLPRYRLRLAAVSGVAGRVSVRIDNVGGGAYRFAQFVIEYDPQMLRLVEVAPAPGAPCRRGDADAPLILLGCGSVVGNAPAISFFGEAATVTFACIAGAGGATPVTLPTQLSLPNIVILADDSHAPLEVQGTTLTCPTG
jgi:hypothetical protein